MMSSQGMVLATAMAVSGTVIILALRLQRSSFPSSQFPLQGIPQTSTPILRSCISQDGKKKKKKKKKRVHFADDVVDSCRDGEEFRRKQRMSRNYSFISKSESKVVEKNFNDKKTDVRSGMPANRVALYNGILRDRVAQRLTYSY